MVEPKLRFPEFNRTWEISKIEDFVNEMRGGASLRPKEILNSGDYKIIPKKSIQSGGKIVIDDNCSYVTSDVFKRFEKNQVDKTYLLVVLRDLVPTGPNIGYIVENDKVENGILAQGVYGFKLSKGLNEQYLIQFSNTPKYRTIMRNIMVGSTQVHIRNSSFLDVKIPYTSLAEQQKIAEFLSTIDTVIAKQKETVSAWEERKKGVMQKLFSQEVRFKADDGSEFPEWEEKKLGDVADFFNGDRSARYPKETDFVKYGVAFLNTENLHNTIVDISEKCKYITYEKYCELSGAKIQLLDIIYCLRGSVGLCSLNTILEEGTVASSLMVIRAVDGIIDPIYLYSDFVLGQLYQCLNGSCAGNLSAKDMAMFKIKCPCLAEQQKIADCLSSLDDVIAKQKATLAAWEELKKGLLQQMFV